MSYYSSLTPEQRSSFKGYLLDVRNDDFVTNTKNAVKNIVNNKVNNAFNNAVTNSVSDNVEQIIPYITGEQQYEWTSALQKATQDYNSAEAEKARAFNAFEAEKARAFSAEQAEITRNFNSHEAELNRAFQQMMSNTAYQRAFADMKEAGLNPYLAYAQGGAPVTSGASATASVATPSMATGSASSANTPSAPNSQMANIVGQLMSSVTNTALGVAKLLF